MNSLVKIVQPSGVLDGTAANDLRREIRNIAENGAEIILVDFQYITFINSGGIGVLVVTLRDIRFAGKKLFICSLSPQVKMLFELTKIDRIFKAFADREEFEKKVMVKV